MSTEEILKGWQDVDKLNTEIIENQKKIIETQRMYINELKAIIRNHITQINEYVKQN